MITRKSGDKEQEKPSAEASFQFDVQTYNDSELELAAQPLGEAEQSFELGGDFKRAADSRAMIADIGGQDGLLEQPVPGAGMGLHRHESLQLGLVWREQDRAQIRHRLLLHN